MTSTCFIAAPAPGLTVSGRIDLRRAVLTPAERARGVRGLLHAGPADMLTLFDVALYDPCVLEAARLAAGREMEVVAITTEVTSRM